VRQSTLVQVERNTESTARQYDLVSRARSLGWPPDAAMCLSQRPTFCQTITTSLAIATTVSRPCRQTWPVHTRVP